MRLAVVLGALLGSAIGVMLILAAGTVCVDGSVSFCGLNYLAWDVRTPIGIALAAATGAVVGALLGAAARRLAATKRSAP